MGRNKYRELARATARRHRLETDHDCGGRTAATARTVSRTEYLQVEVEGEHKYSWERTRKDEK